jgi:predicted DNA-binding ribbon-helix-helix protein
VKTKSTSIARHESHCQICSHARRAEIEEAFLFWESPSQIAKQFKLNRRALCRHVRARNLLKRRDANIRVALSNFIERGMRVRVTAQSFVAACIALSKLDAEGRSIERIQSVGNNDDLFQKMTRGEMLAYAESGALPAWWKKSLPDTSAREEEVLDA